MKALHSMPTHCKPLVNTTRYNQREGMDGDRLFQVCFGLFKHCWRKEEVLNRVCIRKDKAGGALECHI